MPMPKNAVSVLSAAIASGAAGAAHSAPVLVEDGWSLERVVVFTQPISPLINPVDGLLYAGSRNGGVFRILADDSTELLSNIGDVGGLMVDPATGNLFASNDFPGFIERIGTDGTVENWVTGFHSGDDDPTGMCIVPDSYTGDVVTPGTALVADRGFSGPDEVWAWSVETAQDEFAVHTDDGTLVDPFDIAANDTTVLVADASSTGLFIVNADGSLTPLDTPDHDFVEVHAVVADPLSETDFFALDAGSGEVLRVNTDTGAVSVLLTGLTPGVTEWGNVNVSADFDQGVARLIVGNREDGEIYVYSTNIPDPCAADVTGDDAVDLADLNLVLANFGLDTSDGDADGDGQVNLVDLNLVLAGFGADCG
jgi:hypothetical protein